MINSIESTGKTIREYIERHGLCGLPTDPIDFDIDSMAIYASKGIQIIFSTQDLRPLSVKVFK